MDSCKARDDKHKSFLLPSISLLPSNVNLDIFKKIEFSCLSYGGQCMPYLFWFGFTLLRTSELDETTECLGVTVLVSTVISISSIHGHLSNRYSKSSNWKDKQCETLNILNSGKNNFNQSIAAPKWTFGHFEISTMCTFLNDKVLAAFSSSL